MKRTSSTPFSPVSLSRSTSAMVANFSSLVPCRMMIGCRRAMASSEMPSERSSALTPSTPILSSLSMATVISTIFSASPITSAMPVRILRLLTLMATRTPKRVKTVSIICTSSTSLRSESLPTTSASHW